MGEERGREAGDCRLEEERRRTQHEGREAVGCRKEEEELSTTPARRDETRARRKRKNKMDPRLRGDDRGEPGQVPGKQRIVISQQSIVIGYLKKR